ncbi:MAG: ATP-dependent zinc metalloprotease FtsH [Lachnospiraceae bacterium]|nr:ATP-dependent zinc metalloprotease FtsH [Lachnospiraceae bacterium]
MDDNLNSYDGGPGHGPNGSGGPGGNNNGGGPGGPNGSGNDPRKQSLIMLAIAALVTLLCISVFMKMLTGASNQEITYNAFIQMIEDGQVESVTVESDRITIYPKGEKSESPFMYVYGMGTVTYYTGRMEDDDTLTKRLLEHNIAVNKQVSDSSSVIMTVLLYYILPILLMWGLLSLLFRRMGGKGGPMGVGKSTAKAYVQKETGITFKDVAGEDEAKESLVEVVDFLHNPGKYAKIGARLPKGALLVGPPGTGKTLLAKAVAGEAHVPFFSLSGSDFIELYVGVGASRVRDLFKEAEKNAPCIVFIDEIDAIGRSRDSKYGGGNEEREQTLNQLLSEMDGFDGKKGIIILAATNRPEILDKALLRPGRFDRRIIVDKPDLKGRVEILKVHAKDVRMDETVDLNEIALATSGAVGSDLANMINEAAINAVKTGREYVSQKDLFDAVEQVLVGKEKKDRIMSKEERKIVSYHEVGHALISALQKNSEPVQKITIVPRTMGALGYVMHVPEEEKYLDTEAELRDRLVGLLGGRAAEEIVFDTVTTGAANDIEQATSIARNMITRFGMSKKFGLMGLATVESQYLDGRASLTCSEVTAADIDSEVMKLLRDSYKQAKKLLKENREIMDKLAAYLIEKETITGKEFMKIFRKEKGLPEPEEDESGEKKDGDKDEKQMNSAETPSTAQTVQSQQNQPQMRGQSQQLTWGPQPASGQPQQSAWVQWPSSDQPQMQGQPQQPAWGQQPESGRPQMQEQSQQSSWGQQSESGRPQMQGQPQQPTWGQQPVAGSPQMQGQPQQPTWGQQSESGQPLMQEQSQPAPEQQQGQQSGQEPRWMPPHQPQPENRGLFSNAPQPRDDNNNNK